MTTTDITITVAQSKKDIIERLFKNGHISFDEMYTLIKDEKETQYIPYQPLTPQPYPNFPWDQIIY